MSEGRLREFTTSMKFKEILYLEKLSVQIQWSVVPQLLVGIGKYSKLKLDY